MKRHATNTTPAAPPADPPADTLLPDRAVRQITGDISRTTRWRWQHQENFPPPITIGGRSLWSEREIRGWIAQRLARRG